MNKLNHLLGVSALLLIFSTVAAADTLELKDGRVLQGKFLGGTQVIIRFEVDGDVQSFRVTKIVALSFDRNSRNAEPEPQPQADDRRRDDRQRDDRQRNDQYPPSNPPSDNSQYPPADSPQNGQYDPPPSDSRDRGYRAVYAAPGTAITLPAGQPLLVRMIDEVDSKHNQVGDVFHASLETDLAVNDVLVAPRGSDIYGRLEYAKEAGHLSGSAELQLELTRIVIDNLEYNIVSRDYTLRGRGRGGDTAKKVGGGAVAGAIIGAIAGGGTGAAIGAGVGSAAGAGVQVFTRGHEVRVPSETLLEFRLEQPVTVTATERRDENRDQQ